MATITRCLRVLNLTKLRPNIYLFNKSLINENLEKSSMMQFRYYKGSNRNKRITALKQKKRLERELEEKYNISSKIKFNKNEWFKRNYFKELSAFQKRLGIVFNDSSILLSAFAHESFIEEINLVGDENIAIEEDDSDLKTRISIYKQISDFKGTYLSLLGYHTVNQVLKEELYKKYHSLTPHLCLDLVNYFSDRKIIANVATNLAMSDLLLMSKELEELVDIDTEDHMNISKDDILCDTFYSVVGAIEKDINREQSISFVKDFLACLINYEDLSSHVTIGNPHDELRKILSINGVSGICRARIIAESGLQSDFPVVYMGIYFEGLKIGEGSGPSVSAAREDGFKNTVFMCLENEIDFNRLKDTKQFLKGH